MLLCKTIVFAQVPTDIDPSNNFIRNKFNTRYTTINPILDQTSIKGDMLIIGNNNLSKSKTLAYNDIEIGPSSVTANDNINMVFVDIDEAGAGTFNSSSANLLIPSSSTNPLRCSRIVYAGLYWSATYKYNTIEQSSGRSNDWNKVKFRTPTGAYQEITATEILYNGFDDALTAPTEIVNQIQHRPYSCYADVTNIVKGSPGTNPNGNYFVGNIRATLGRNPFVGGTSAGWSLVIVYENISLPSKFIATFDGHGIIKSQSPAMEIPVSGFKSLPAPRTVKARIGSMALEGDYSVTGDQFLIKAGANPTFSALTNPGITGNLNYFNSSISLNNTPFNNLTNRNPNSINTLGWDSHLEPIIQSTSVSPAAIIPNDTESAILQIKTAADKFDIFFTSFDVEVIQPIILLTKKVRDIVNNQVIDIDNEPLDVNQGFYYSLEFKNIGNDNAINFTIVDDLPQNIVFPPIGTTIQPGNLTLDGVNIPPTQYTFNPITKTLVFSISPTLVLKNSGNHEIRIYVRTPASCEEVVNACDSYVRNQAFFTYQGEENNDVVSNNPSYSEYDICSENIQGPTNFLVDISLCDLGREEILCAGSISLTAPSGYNSYSWSTPNGTIIGNTNTQTITASSIGDYIVYMVAPAPCTAVVYTINVVSFAQALIKNPIIPFADNLDPISGEVIAADICPNTNVPLPKIFLCGSNDFVNINLNLTGTTVLWEKLVTTCLPLPLGNCANTNPGCTWNPAGTGQTFLANTNGQYRVTITYQNNCFQTFYFNVYKNNFNPNVTKKDVICGVLGSLIITDTPIGYEYSLSPAGPWTDITSVNVIGNLTPNNYIVYIKQKNVASGCVFEIPKTISNVVATTSVTKVDKNCNNGFGSITVNYSGLNPQIYYQLLQGSTVVQYYGPTTLTSYTFNNVLPNASPYTVKAWSDSGCPYTDTISLTPFVNIILTAVTTKNINCTNGNVLLTTTNGLAPLSYAIYSVGGVLVDPINYVYFTDPNYPISTPGIYVFLVQDANNCPVLSNQVEVRTEPIPIINEVHTNIKCFADTPNGIITLTPGNTAGYIITYSLNGILPYQTENVFTGLNDGAYTIFIKYSTATNECIYEKQITITRPPALTGAATLIQGLTCTISRGEISVSASGGTGPYQYSINGGSTFVSSTSFPNLTVNSTGYSIIIRDANLCTFTTNVIPLTVPVEPTAISTNNTSSPTCANPTTSFTATVTGGTAPYTFTISPTIATAIPVSGATATFTNVPVGFYTITVKDKFNCDFSIDKNILGVSNITAATTATSSISCLTSTDGQATFTIGNFSNNYSYVFNNQSVVTNQTATSIIKSNLDNGTYTLVVTDLVTGCTAQATATINPPPGQLVLSSPFIQPTCDLGGSVNASASSGWGGYQFTLTYPDATTVVGPRNDGLFINLNQTGLYTISITDIKGCSVSNQFELNTYVGPGLEFNASTLDFCLDEATGAAIGVTITGGTPVYQYQVSYNNGPFGALNSIGGNTFTYPITTSGNYTIKVIDQNGCSATISKVIAPQLQATLALTKSLDCTLTNPNAEVTVQIQGGVTGYQYQVSSDNGITYGALTSVTTNPFNYPIVTSGTYKFKIIDQAGCIVIKDIIVTAISNPSINQIQITTPVRCNGEKTGAIAVIMNSGFGTGQLQYSLNNGPFQVENTFSPLFAGSYTVTVKDANGCQDIENIDIGQPELITGNIRLEQDLTCDLKGKIIVENVLGGTPGTSGYEYSSNGIDFQSSPIFLNLEAGAYIIIIRDSRGCIATTNEIVILPALKPTDITQVATPVQCPSLTYAVTVSPVGGIAPFVFQIIAPTVINPNSSTTTAATFINLQPGVIYKIKVKDSKNCDYLEDYLVQPITNIAVTGTVNSNVACLNGDEGKISFNVSGFLGTYSYTINGSSPIIQNDLQIIKTGLIAGNYEIIVKDLLTNCEATITKSIGAPPSQLLLDAPIVQPTCSVGGQVNATATGGWNFYEYTLIPDISGTSPKTDGLFTGLLAGTLYTIQVKDLNGCEVSSTFTLNNYSSPSLEIDPNSILCYNSVNQASISVTVSGGTAAYQYQIQYNGGLYGTLQDNATFPNLIPGNYTIKVIDRNGCEGTINQVISEQLLAQVTKRKGLKCEIPLEAEISITISGGIPTYQYQVSTDNGTTYGALIPITTNPFTYYTAIAGNFKFKFTDAAGCTIESGNIEIDPIVNPSFTLAQTGYILCKGGNGGQLTATLNPSLGVGPFLFSVNNGPFVDNNGVFSELVAGSYTITVKDSNLCIYSDIKMMDEPDEITFSLAKTDLFCNEIPGGGLTNGSITVQNVTGGEQTYTYILRNITFGVIATYTTTTNENYTFPVDFGNYSVEVIDNNGCSKIEYTRILSPPSSLISTTTSVNCLTGATVDVTVTATIAGSNYLFGILDQDNAPYANPLLPPNVPGGLVKTFSGLRPGVTYTFVVFDNLTQCYFIQNVPTAIPPTSTVQVTNLVVNNVACKDDANGFVSFQLSNFATTTTAVTYQLFTSVTNIAQGTSTTSSVSGPGAIVTINPFGALAPGEYYLLVTENSGCTRTSNSFIINQSSQALEVIAEVVSNDTCALNAGLINAYGQFGTPPYKFIIQTSSTDPTISDLTWSDSGEFFVEGETDYFVFIKDANNCIKKTPMRIETDPIPAISLSLTPCTIDGEHQITVTNDLNGIEPYFYTLNGGEPVPVQNQALFTIENLVAGVYNIQILDANGCGVPTPLLTINKNLSGTASALTQPSCDINDGAIQAVGLFGTGSYNYTLLGTTNNILQGPIPAGSFIGFSSLGFGDYIVKIEDSFCKIEIPVKLLEPTNVTFTVAKINPKCDGEFNGTITVTLPASNLNPPYTYTLTAPFPFVTISGSNPVFTGLEENNYLVTVTSGRGCKEDENVILDAPEPLVVTDPNTYLFLCTATNTVSSITLNGLVISGGTSPYQYSIDNTTFQPITELFVINNTGLPQNITIYVKDANGCTKSFIYPTIFPQTIITAVNDNPTSNLSCEAPIQEVVDFTIVGGSGSFSYQVLPSTMDIDVIGNTFTETFTSSGTFYIKIKDKITLCTFTKIYRVDPVPSAIVVATPITPVTCYNDTDGTLKFEISNYTGSYDYTVYQSPSNIVEQATATGSNTLVIISNLEAGNYYVIIKQNDFPKCEITSNVITIGSPTNNLILNLAQTPNSPCAVTNTGFNSGTITAIASGGNGGIQYQLLNSSNGIVYDYSPTRNVFGQLANGLYTVKIKDSKNCPKEKQITVGLDTSPSITLALVDACATDGNFAVRVTRTTTGIAPYFYRVDDGPVFEVSAAVFTIPNLLGSATPHKIEIIDNKGCKESKTLLITPKASGFIDITTQPGCTFGGSIKAIINGGTGPSFTYNLINNSNPSVVIDTNITGVFSGVLLVSGTYTINVIDANHNTIGSNCVTSLTTTLETPTRVEFTLETTKPSCSGFNNGIIKVVLDPNFTSNPEYTYTISDGVNILTQDSPIFNTNISANILYTITVKSGRGCEKVLTATLIDRPELEISGPDTFSFTCTNNQGQNNITLSGIVVAGGTPDYSYSSNGIDFREDFIFTFTDIGVDQTIVISVKDLLGCIKTKNYFLKTLQTITSATVSNLKLLTCSVPTEAKIKVDIIGGSGQYDYQIMPTGTVQSVAGNSFEQTFATSGNYIIKIIDRVSNCSILQPIRIQEIQPVSVNLQAITNVACNGGTTGVLQFSVSGYVGNYNYEVINNETGLVVVPAIATSTLISPITIPNREAGSYYIKITELQDPKCEISSAVVNITTPSSAVSLTIVESAPVTCNPTISGSITITNISGGVGNYSYQLVSMLPTPNILVPFSPLPTNSTFYNLPAGSYKVMVLDSNLCPDEKTIVLEPASQINAEFSVTNQALSCYGGTNASVTVTNVTNGQGNYSYALTYPNGSVAVQIDPVFNNLPAGEGYFITVLDGWDCDRNLPTFNITQPEELKASIVPNGGITCLDNSPSIKVSASGGTAPYTIVETGQTFTTTIDIDVAMPSNTTQEGIFQFTIRDFRGCPTVLTNEITIYPITNIDLFLDTSNTDLNCFNDTNASITATATGGLGNYNYTLLNAGQQVIMGPQPSGFFGGAILAVGSYFIKVVSDGGCSKTLPFNITTSPEISYQQPIIKNVTCWGGNDGKITINVSGGTPEFEYGITPNSQATIEENVFENLEAGDYEININDGKGCPKILYVRVNEPDPLGNTDPILVQEICDGTNTGSMSFQILGGRPPYKISYENQDNYRPIVGNVVNYTGLGGGETHTVFIRDKFDCDWVVTSIFQNPFVLNTTLNIQKNCPTVANPKNNLVTVTPSVGSPTVVQYSLDNPNSFQGNNFFANVTTGVSHIIYIKNGTCNTVTQRFTIDQPIPLNLTVAESGLNQITATTTGGSIPYSYSFNEINTGENNVYLYNESGSILVKVVDNNFCEAQFRIPVTFYDIEIPNFFTPISEGWTPLKIDNFKDIETKVFDRYGREIAILRRGEKWDGNYKNNPLPSGDYWYIVDVKDGTGRTFVGNVTLYR